VSDERCWLCGAPRPGCACTAEAMDREIDAGSGVGRPHTDGALPYAREVHPDDVWLSTTTAMQGRHGAALDAIRDRELALLGNPVADLRAAMARYLEPSALVRAEGYVGGPIDNTLPDMRGFLLPHGYRLTPGTRLSGTQHRYWLVHDDWELLDAVAIVVITAEHAHRVPSLVDEARRIRRNLDAELAALAAAPARLLSPSVGWTEHDHARDLARVYRAALLGRPRG